MIPIDSHHSITRMASTLAMVIMADMIHDRRKARRPLRPDTQAAKPKVEDPRVAALRADRAERKRANYAYRTKPC